jgi:diguanylate cyclase (GGDEF)-like protein
MVAPTVPYAPGVIAVLDSPGEGERRVTETVLGAGLAPRVVANVGELGDVLRSGEAQVAIVGLEALRRNVERSLRALRQGAPAAFLVLVHADGSARLHLARRLWISGLVDALVPRSAPPHELGPVLRQALAEAASPDEDEAGEEGPVDPARLDGSVVTLRGLAGGFAAQRTIEGVVRELHMKLPRLVTYDLAEVLVPEETGTRLYVCPSHPLTHEQIWRLAGDVCRRVAPLIRPAPTVEQLLFVELPAASGSAAATTDPDRARRLTFPMVLGGEPVGCLGLQVPGPLYAVQMSLLRLFSAQLATALRYVQTLQAAEAASLKDELTGAHNRRFLTRVLEGEWRRSKRYHLQLSVAMLDIDHFKRLNDVHGHLVGDAVLRSFGALIGSHLRTTDLLVRYGGEEFLVVFPETGVGEAVGVIDRLRVLVSHSPLARDLDGGDVHITFSAGVAAEPMCGSTSPAGLLQAADQALLQAKQGGRDRVVAARECGLLKQPGEPGGERRRAIRVATSTPAVFVPLPAFEPRPARLQAVNVSSTGVAVRGQCDELQPHTHGLVYLDEDRRPHLAKVMWMRRADAARDAGLRFVTPDELVARHAGDAAERPRALVVARQSQTRAVVERVLKAAAYDIDFFSEEQALTSVWLHDYALLIVGDTTLRGDLGRLLQQLRSAGEAGFRIIAVNENNDRRDALTTIAEQQIEHLVAGEDASEALFVTLSKLLLGEYFGINKYLQWGAEVLSWTCGSTTDKDAALEGIRQLAREVRCHPRILDLLVSAVDEMVINALFVGPQRGDAERPPVTVQCGSDGRLLGVAVLDEHGVFRPEDMFSAIGTALQIESNGLPPSADRGHLGFRIMLGTLSQLAINVDPGRCTEVIGIVDLRKSLREYRQQAPSLGVFETKP